MMKLFKDINPRLVLAIFLVPLAIVIAAVPENTTKQYKLTVEELVGEITEGAQYFTSDQIADYIVQKDPLYQLIDVRSADEFETYHLPGAINIPLSNILADEWLDYLDQDVLTNVFYSNGTVNANQAWLICTQRGFVNNYVMQGGLNHWAETIMNPTKPSSTAASDEFAKYDFRKAMNAALGGGTLEASTEPVKSKAPMPAVKKKSKKKRPQGGC